MPTRSTSPRWSPLLAVVLVLAAVEARAATTSLLTCPVSTMPGQQFTLEVKVDVGAAVLGAYTI